MGIKKISIFEILFIKQKVSFRIKLGKLKSLIDRLLIGNIFSQQRNHKFPGLTHCEFSDKTYEVFTLADTTTTRP